MPRLTSLVDGSQRFCTGLLTEGAPTSKAVAAEPTKESGADGQACSAGAEFRFAVMPVGFDRVEGMEISLPVAIAVVLLFLAVGVGIGYLLGQSRAQARQADARMEMVRLEARAERLEEENDALIERAQSDQNVLRALSPITSSLAAMTTKVGQLEKSQAAASAQLSQQLTTTHESSRDLFEVTSSLRRALTSTSARGSWGEAELERIVTAAGMLPHVHFDTQATVESSAGGRQRPDMLIYLPGDGVIAVDSKVPLSAYMEAVEISADDPSQRSQREILLAEHAKAVRGHVLALAKRNYPSQFEHSPQLTIMFMPTESLLSEAVRANPGLLDEAARHGVAITSPSSLLALLRAVAATWSSSRVTQEAGEVLALGKDLVQRLGDLSKHLTTLGSRLSGSVQAYNRAVGTLESRLLVTARGFESLPGDSLEVKELDYEAAQVRTFSRSELVTD